MISNNRWTETILLGNAHLKQKFAWLQANFLCFSETCLS